MQYCQEYAYSGKEERKRSKSVEGPEPPGRAVEVESDRQQGGKRSLTGGDSILEQKKSK